MPINGKHIGNRFAVQPMEGWDGTRTGGVTEEVLRRWTRFGESGAKLICGGEAMAVRPDGRANPNQLIIQEQNKADLARLRETLRQSPSRTPRHGGRSGRWVSIDAFGTFLPAQRQAPRIARGLPPSDP